LIRAAQAGLVTPTSVGLNRTAIVWRTWYSTLNQLMLDLSAAERAQIEIVPLPKGISVAGEWYLAVPAHSAAPDVALNLMKLLTSRDAELERMKRGVGLPTRLSFFRSKQANLRTHVSPFFTMNIDVIGEIVDKAFARSSFGCYAQVAGVLSPQLQAIVELTDEAVAARGIEMILERLTEEVGFVLNDSGCAERGSCGPVSKRPAASGNRPRTVI
jgi:hypothetical protein